MSVLYSSFDITKPPLPTHGGGTHDAAQSLERYHRVRAQTMKLIAPLSAEDCQSQSMPDASPIKWHLAHTTWFFETFVLEKFEPGFAPFNAAYRVLFNSYYNAVGDKHPRPLRGMLTRPTLSEVLAWRENVDRRIALLMCSTQADAATSLVQLGTHHEQQHQELILTDLKHLFSCNGLHPSYAKAWPLAAVAPALAQWVKFPGGMQTVGHAGDQFAFDNESPQHTVLLQPYALMNRLVTNGEWMEFIEAGGYQQSQWWLSAGWDWIQSQQVHAPLYWRRDTSAPGNGKNRGWHCFTLHGLVPTDPHTPVTHVSYFEADAFATWKRATDASCAGARLPTEFEWEAAAAPHAVAATSVGNLLENGTFHPMPVTANREGLMQTVGDVWEWTSSAYAPYPGFSPWAGAVGEYNGKFMVNQYVLRGGSCVTPRDHIRASYRNFFPTDARWQFTGVRLARSM